MTTSVFWYRPNRAVESFSKFSSISISTFDVLLTALNLCTGRPPTGLMILDVV